MRIFLNSLAAPSRVRVAMASLALFFAAASPAFAAPISGVVMNLTVNKPSAGDTVSLIRLQQGMQVAAQTKTDATGLYTLNVTDSDPMHLVRVTHQGADYFQAAPPGRSTVNVDVYNVAEKVSGITTEADVQRMETDQNQLRVTENFFVKNSSSPPLTQFGPHAYPIYLPKGADIVAAAALGPGSMPVQSSPVPIGPGGEYAFVFPLRPGETRFQVSYRVPYSGRLQLEPRVASPVDNFALILPKSMHFTGVPASGFQPIDQDTSVQTYLAKNLRPGSNVAFRISGSGQLPQETPASANGGNAGPPGAAPGATENPQEAAQAAAENNTRPGIGLGVPVDTPDPLHKYKWWILSLVVVLLAVGAGVSMKQPAPAAAAATTPTPTTSAPVAARSLAVSASAPPLLQVLKEELFALETERLQGRIGAEEYERQKSALEIVIKRAIDRSSAGSSQPV